MALETITLSSLIDQAKDMADMQNTTFVSDTEWTRYLNQGVRELYDLLLEAHGQEYFLKTFEITLTPPTNTYSLPDDLLAVKGVDYSTTSFPAQEPETPILGDKRYDVLTTDIGNTDVVEILPYNFADRHDASPLKSVWRGRHHPLMRYRVFAEEISTYTDDVGPGNFVSDGYFNRIRVTPAESGYLLVWYVPQVPLLSSGGTAAFPFWHGWQLYPALFAAKIALDKEESDSTAITRQLDRMHKRLQNMAMDRDAGNPEVVQDTFYGDWW